jgi:hypothetical protein
MTETTGIHFKIVRHGKRNGNTSKWLVRNRGSCSEYTSLPGTVTVLSHVLLRFDFELQDDWTMVNAHLVKQHIAIS